MHGKNYPSKLKKPGLHLVSFLLGFSVCHVWRTQISDPTRQAVEVTFPGGAAVKIDSSKPAISHDKVLNDIFADRFTREGLMGWLAEKNIFLFTDPRLADALNNSLCEPIPAEPVDQRIRAAQTCADQAVAKSLRDLVEAKKVPFHYVGRLVRVGFPADSQPKDGYANVCEERELRSTKFELTNLQTEKRIEVQASGRYACTGFTRVPDVQLNFADARKLFPTPLDKYEEAIAVPLN